ncbi:MAG: hypothetical protein FWC19_09525 [Treponema sp.]|nr:hypothetical protein [Treponema sp.]MCL2273024.1 hypothetical protein [Treponema sp.]
MVKQIISTVLLLILCVFSVFIGLKPFGPFSAWQQLYTEPEIETETETGDVKEAAAEIADQLNDGKKTARWRSVQQSLAEKTDQVSAVWEIQKSIHGTISVLLSSDVKSVYPSANPIVSLSPVNAILDKISKYFLHASGVLAFEKTLLIFYVPLTFLVLIPACVLVFIYVIWTYRDKKRLHRVLIVSVLFCLILAFAVPLSLKLSALTGDKILSKNVNTLISSMEEIHLSNVNLDNEIKRFRKTEAAITGYLSTAKDISNTVIKDSINYIVIFMFVYILVPVLVIIALCLTAIFSAILILRNNA